MKVLFMTSFYSRRKFVDQCLRWVPLLLSVGLTAGACNQNKPGGENQEPVESCDDYTGVSEAELEKRKKFAYVDKSADVAKQCNACKLYLPPRTGEKCGACTLFKGPVDSSGSCTYWAPLDPVS